MNILILATGYPRWKGDVSSAKNYLHTLAKSLVMKGVETHVIAPHANGLKKEEIMDGVHIHRFQYLYPSNLQTLAYFPGLPEKIKTINGKIQVLPLMFSMTKKMIEIVRKYDIDIINAHWAIPPGFIATVTKKLHKRPVVVRIYGAELFPFIGKKGLFAKIAKWMIGYALNNAKKVVGNSTITCVAGSKISGREDIEVLPDGVDTETFNPEVDGSEIRKKYNLEGNLVISSSGRMVERKGFIYLIKAMPHILKKFPKTKLIISGDGPERKNLENEVKKLRMEKSVIFPGFIPDRNFPNYMRACDVFILPSIIDSTGDTEGLGLVLAEAMACGTPVIGSDVGGITDIIKDRENGFLAVPRNPEDIAQKIIRLLSDEELKQKFSDEGLKKVQEKFSWAVVNEKFVKIYEGLK